MRFAMLLLFLGVGMTAYCQSTASGSASSDQQRKGPSSTSTWSDFDKLPSNWQAGITGQAKTFTAPGSSLFRQREKAQGDSKMHFHLSQPGTAAALETPLLAQNDYPLRPNVLSQWPNLKVEPIPTQWLSAKAEPIPTQWPDLRMLTIAAQRGTPAATQAATK